MPFYPSKVLRAKERASTPCSSAVFSLDSHLSPLRSLGMRQIGCPFRFIIQPLTNQTISSLLVICLVP
jgi:hypothetical protein